MIFRSEHALFRHHRLLTARVAGRLGTGEAEDLASEAVLRGLTHPAPDGRQAPWIETIFRNLLADRGRRAARRPASVASNDEMAGQDVATPEELVLAAERARAVAAALPGIPDELRDAVEGRFFAEQDYEELAGRRGISVITARTRVHRGLARLRQALAGVRALVPAWPAFSTGGISTLAALVPAAVAVLAILPQAPTPLAEAPAIALVSPHAHGPGRATRTPWLAERDDVPVANQGGETTRGVRRVRPTAPARAPAPPPDTDSAPVAVKHMDFDDDEVDGDLQPPGVALVSGDPREQKLGSLIEIPRSFEPSMTKMIEDM